MTADIEMLPLPEHFAHQSERVQEHVRAYARAVAEHNVAARDAEIEALRAEVRDLKGQMAGDYLHVADTEADWKAAEARAERLAEALRWYANPEVYKPHPHGPAFDDRDLSFKARAALRDHDQEVGNG